jgi:NAD(P)-dependent dehydrogenase (short-subunit alcohol dehydrogenase family)
LAGKTAFVTGAASGIGLGIASRLAHSGVKVMLCDIDTSALETAVSGLRSSNVDVDYVKADVSLKAELREAAEATLARYGEVHVLVNNAGVAGGGGYGQWDDADWEWTLGVNLMGVIWGVEIFGPLIERHGQGGHIVNTSSIAGLVSSLATPYAVSKYGVVALSEGLRTELAPKNIGVSVLCPSAVRTQIIESVRNLPDRFKQGAAAPDWSSAPWHVGTRALLSRCLEPDYVGDLVVEAIEGDWPYIFTDNDYEAGVDNRFANIKASFDKIRGRTPRREGREN